MIQTRKQHNFYEQTLQEFEIFSELLQKNRVPGSFLFSSVKTLVYTYAAKCENPIFVELLGRAAHLHGAVTLLLHQHRLSFICSVPVWLLVDSISLNLLLPAGQVNFENKEFMTLERWSNHITTVFLLHDSQTSHSIGATMCISQ